MVLLFFKIWCTIDPPYLKKKKKDHKDLRFHCYAVVIISHCAAILTHNPIDVTLDSFAVTVSVKGTVVVEIVWQIVFTTTCAINAYHH